MVKLDRILPDAAKQVSLPIPLFDVVLYTPLLTPLLTARTLHTAPPCPQATVYAKLEMQNPGGSLKDRIALNMIEKAEKEGKISPGKTTLVDFTSGNTGIGEAMARGRQGLQVHHRHASSPTDV